MAELLTAYCRRWLPLSHVLSACHTTASIWPDAHRAMGAPGSVCSAMATPESEYRRSARLLVAIAAKVVPAVTRFRIV